MMREVITVEPGPPEDPIPPEFIAGIEQQIAEAVENVGTFSDDLLFGLAERYSIRLALATTGMEREIELKKSGKRNERDKERGAAARTMYYEAVFVLRGILGEYARRREVHD